MDALTEPRKLRVTPLNADLPPLRVHHLLIWMTVTAVLISVSIWFDRMARNGPPIQSRIVVGSLMLGAIAIAGAFTFAGLGINWRNQEYPFPRGPGEWMLGIMAYGVLALIVAFLGIFVAFAFRLLTLYYFIAGVVLFVIWVLATARGIIFYADTIAWRFVYGALGLVTPLAGVMHSALPMVVLLICTLWASADDLWRDVSRGWLHWLGVVFVASLTCAAIGAIDGARLFR